MRSNEAIAPLVALRELDVGLALKRRHVRSFFASAAVKCEAAGLYCFSPGARTRGRLAWIERRRGLEEGGELALGAFGSPDCSTSHAWECAVRSSGARAAWPAPPASDTADSPARTARATGRSSSHRADRRGHGDRQKHSGERAAGHADPRPAEAVDEPSRHVRLDLTVHSHHMADDSRAGRVATRRRSAPGRVELEAQPLDVHGQRPAMTSRVVARRGSPRAARAVPAMRPSGRPGCSCLPAPARTRHRERARTARRKSGDRDPARRRR